MKHLIIIGDHITGYTLAWVEEGEVQRGQDVRTMLALDALMLQAQGQGYTILER